MHGKGKKSARFLLFQETTTAYDKLSLEPRSLWKGSWKKLFLSQKGKWG